MSDAQTEHMEQQEIDDYVASLERAVELREGERDRLAVLLQEARQELAEKDAAIAELVSMLDEMRIWAGYAVGAVGVKANSRCLQIKIMAAKELIRKHQPRKELE